MVENVSVIVVRSSLAGFGKSPLLESRDTEVSELAVVVVRGAAYVRSQ